MCKRNGEKSGGRRAEQVVKFIYTNDVAQCIFCDWILGEKDD